jgi:lipopolysaccharide/colanic/teichoic acid biosynthesis glycosyltransferase
MSSISKPRPYRTQRVLDWAILVTVAAPAAIVGGCFALATRLTSKGPIIFRQKRVGLHGELFEVLKFRTMVDAPEGNPVFPDADRITKVGAFLRRFSLDELPQLLNVARGEMSVVGPRPTLSYQVDRYTEHQRHRLDVRPGLTGLAQVRGRNRIGWRERIGRDLEYVDRQSLFFDLVILARTVPAVLSGADIEGHPTDDRIAAP